MEPDLYSESSKPKSRYLPPQDLEAEKSLLGGLLLDSAALSKIVDLGLEPTDFYRESNGKIYEAILSLHGKGEPVDIVTLSAHLKNLGLYEQVGGAAFLTGLFEEAFSSAHVFHYAKIVKEKSTLRKVISASHDLIETAHSGVENLEEFLDTAEKAIFEVTSSKTRASAASIKDILLANMQRIQELSEKSATVTGLATGLREFDRMTSGLQPGQLIIIAARPAMGKTSLALNIAEHAAVIAKAGVIVFSLEMAKEELGIRFLTGLAKVDASALKVGRLKEKDWKSLTKAAGTLSESKIFVDDTGAINVMEMRSRCRRVQAEHGLGLVIVDYLQLMRGTSKNSSENREREISEISRGLKSLAKELRCPIIALSQLNRGVEARSDKRPMLSDLRESGAIEQDADIVTFVYRDEVYNKESEDKGIAEFIVAKHRAGSVGTIRLRWDAQFTAFSNEDDMPAPSAGGGQAYAPPSFDEFGNFESSSGSKPGGGNPPKKGGLDLPNF